MNLRTIQTIILQNQKRLLENQKIVPRELTLESIPKKASVLIGIRRCGKSTYIQNLLENSISDKSLICWIDFADDRLTPLQAEEPAQIADAYYQLYPDYHEKTVYFFFDEIQLVHNWALFVNRLQNTENCKVFITGSSAKMLSKELATELGGSSLSYELFPYSFTEFLSAHDIRSKHDILLQLDKVNALFTTYCNWGGFPELLYINDEVQKSRYLQNLAMDVITRDIAMRYKIQDLAMLHALMLMLLDAMGKPITINKLKQRLSGMHYSTSSEWISKYFDYFSDAYLIFPVEILSPNAAVRAVNPKKIYCVDHALSKACDAKIFDNTVAILENIVFIHIRKISDAIHYYKTTKGYEIDFVTGSEGNFMLYQVCADLSDDDTKKREFRAIKEACNELNCTKACIIVLNQESETVQLDTVTVNVVNAVDWLIE